MAESKIPLTRMPLEERAKIFVPFDPLKGFREALAERERAAVDSVHDFHPLDADDPGRADLPSADALP